MWSLSSIISLNGVVCDRESTSVYSGDKYVQYIRTGIHGLLSFHIVCICKHTLCNVHIHVRCLCSVYMYTCILSCLVRSFVHCFLMISNLTRKEGPLLSAIKSE